MRRRLLLIAVIGFGLSFLLFADHRQAQAQPRSGSDTIRFMAAVRGSNYDGTGLKWCVSQSWHESYPASTDPSNPYPAGPPDALDEVSQTGVSSCVSQRGDLVDFAYNGSSNDGSNCTTSAPCPSLLVKGIPRVYGNGCHAIEADLYDYSTYDTRTGTGDWKGKQRILHASASSPLTFAVYIAWQTWYFDFVTVGTIIDPEDPRCPWTGPHAHQDFMLSTQSGYCQTTNNGAIPPKSESNPSGFSKDWYRQNPDHYIHSLVHSYGVACVVPGPDAANWLLRSGGGELNDTGQGMRDLASGAKSSITSAQTCITGTSWCGTYTATPQLAVAAYRRYQGMSPIDYFNAQQRRFPPSGDTSPHYWYNEGGYYFYIVWQGDVPYPYGYLGSDSCGGAWTDYGQAILGTWYYGSSPIPCVQSWMNPGAANLSAAGVANAWAQFRGAGGIDPSLTPAQLQQEANNWVLTNDWTTVVKPNVYGVISAARNQIDMDTLGITANRGNSFDGQRW